jgi:predicted small secreted protein
MRAFAVLALVVLAGSPVVAGTVEVKVTGAGLDVKATAAPLSDVL